MLLDFFEDRVDIGKLTTMAQAEIELNKFIQFNDRALLSGKGHMSRLKADKHAQLQYTTFAEIRRKERLE
jgi:hypothetical protein